MDSIVYFVFAFVAVCILIIIAISICSKRKINNFKYSAQTVNIGDSMESVISKYGNKYSISHLKNGIDKYEWKIRINGTSYGTGGVRSYSGTKTMRFSVKCKNGFVVETNSLNLD